MLTDKSPNKSEVKNSELDNFLNSKNDENYLQLDPNSQLKTANLIEKSNSKNKLENQDLWQSEDSQKNQIWSNFWSIFLAIVIFLALSYLYFWQINFLNFLGKLLSFSPETWIDNNVFSDHFLTDFVIGTTIYLKTSVDFGILIGTMMSRYPGFKNRVAIENGTAFGNALGTMTVLTVWFFFKEVKWLLALMVFLASLVLFRLAMDGLDHVHEVNSENLAENPQDKNTEIKSLETQNFDFSKSIEISPKINLANNTQNRKTQNQNFEELNKAHNQTKIENLENLKKLENSSKIGQNKNLAQSSVEIIEKNLSQSQKISNLRESNQFSNTKNSNNKHPKNKVPKLLLTATIKLEKLLAIPMRFINPVLDKVMPNLKVKNDQNLTFWGLLGTSFVIPFILGLDDFAGYVPLFKVINVFGFGIGVFFGHCVLNILLFISPERTIAVVKNPFISFFGSIIFISLACFGLWEVVKILTH